MHTLAKDGFGLTWVYPQGADFIKKSLAPSFIFFDSEQFTASNASHRLKKRGISAFVSVAAPLRVLTFGHGLARAAELTGGADGSAELDKATSRARQSVELACAAGADAIVICDDLVEGGIAVAPLTVLEQFMPRYRMLVEAAAEAGVPAVFSASGDIRDFYPALAEAGFSGVLVAHPERPVVSELFISARANGLIPIGGIIGCEASSAEVNDAAEFACGLVLGEELICDDGHLEGESQIGWAVAVLTATRDRVHAKLGK